MAAGAAAVPARLWAAPVVPVGRRLRLVDAHSGTVFDAAYRDDKGPIRTAVVELDMFLRDRRSGGVTNIDVGVLDFLAGVMAAIGEKSAVVLSAYRSMETNRLLERTNFGVADNSQHLYGRALDVSFPAARLADAVAAARAMRRGGVGWYPRSKFVHLDTGPVRNWELGAEGLEDELLKWPNATPISRKPTGVMLVEGRGRLTVGGGKPPVVAPSRTVRLADGQVAGLLQAAPKAP